MGNTSSAEGGGARGTIQEEEAPSRVSYRRRLSPGVDFQSLNLDDLEDGDVAAPVTAATAVDKAFDKMGQAVKKAGHNLDKMTHRVGGAVMKTPRHLQNVFAKPLALDTVMEKTTGAFYKPPVYKKGKATDSFLHGVLKDHFVFRHLPAETLETLVQAFEQHEVDAGTNLITQGELATSSKDYFYILLSGTVQFIVNDKVVGKAENSGDAFGELALLYSCPRAATVHAVTNVTVYRIQQRAFRWILQLQRETAEKTKVALLSEVPIFEGLKQRQLHKLAEMMTPFPFQKGDVLCRRGDDIGGKVFSIVQSGELLVTNLEMGGAAYSDVTLKAGDYGGQDAIVQDYTKRLADCTAKTDGLLFYLDTAALQSVLGPDLKTAFQERGALARAKRKLGMIPVLHDNPQVDNFILEAMVDLLQTKTFHAGQSIVYEGVRVEAALYFVTKGAVELSSTKTPDLQSKIETGGFFGEEQLRVDADVMERRKRSRKKKQVYLDVIPTTVPKYTVTVTEDCTCQILYLKELRNVMDTTRMDETKTDEAAAEEDAHKVPFNELKRHKILGAGTFGQVWLVSYDDKDHHEKQAYALKVQSKYQLCQSGQAKAVVQEKNIMAALHHPFLANLVDSYQDEKCVYMLMGLVQGGELHAIIHDDRANRHGVPEADAMFFAAGIHEGLSFLHRRGYVYRDLKPENVLISDRGYPVIVDYGFVKYIESKTYTFCGTPLYLAPEIILNTGHDWGADHWSYGVMMFEMLYGYVPFYEEGMDQMALFKAIVEMPVNYPPGCSTVCEDFLKKLLVRRPSRRLGSHGADDIARHKWLSKIDFHKLFKQEYKSPYPPKLKNPLDTANFSSWSHLKDKTKEHYPPLTAKEKEYFKNF